MDQDVLDFDDDFEHVDLPCPRPNASDPSSRLLRPLARSPKAEFDCDLRIVEALRRSADAVLSRQHADQPRGER